MAKEPTPPAPLPAGFTDECATLSPTQIRALATYAETLAEYRERQTRLEAEDEAEDESAAAVPDERPAAVPTNASVTVKEINDNRYRYWQWRDGDKIKSKYIGPAQSTD
ncbi:hypothetical protein [Haloarcula laminariae]|uniref:hypothetical protein n=1 Tax=Haloarcula laminariae TaxID=2961577 RepID=UPI0021C8FC89|nr:hypothetical protein [Halomicroarcula laminariae]